MQRKIATGVAEIGDKTAATGVAKTGDEVLLQLDNYSLNVGARELIAGADFCLARGQIKAILGRSGCGKTSLLKALVNASIAALSAPAPSPISATPVAPAVSAQPSPISAPPVAFAAIAFAPGVRVAFMQQQALLLEQFDALKNVALPAIIAGADEKSALAQAAAIMSELGIAHLARNFADELSGGEAQRVNLARALAQKADILLLDEPFSALDFLNKLELKKLLKTHLRTAILITHDITDALEMADEIYVIAGQKLTPVDKKMQAIMAKI